MKEAQACRAFRRVRAKVTLERAREWTLVWTADEGS